jgi:hypothetical protein
MIVYKVHELAILYASWLFVFQGLQHGEVIVMT